MVASQIAEIHAGECVGIPSGLLIISESRRVSSGVNEVTHYTLLQMLVGERKFVGRPSHKVVLPEILHLASAEGASPIKWVTRLSCLS
jgi:hypothetical protein